VKVQIYVAGGELESNNTLIFKYDNNSWSEFACILDRSFGFSGFASVRPETEQFLIIGGFDYQD
jgi:hypothetical protein